MRYFLLFAASFFVMGAQCGGATTTTAPATPVATAPVAPVAPVAPIAPPPPPAPTYATTLFTCCDNEKMNWLMEEYIDVAEALVTDDKRLDGQVTALLGTAKAGLKGGMDASSQALLQSIKSGSETMLKQDTAGKRITFKNVSSAVISLARAHKGGSKYQLAELYCASSGAGWLTDKDQVANPYDTNNKTCGTYR